MKAYRFPEYDTPIKVGEIVTIIGGGNTALDASRVARRLGAKRVIVVYRRSELEMPARREEYHHTVEKGIKFQFLTNPIRFIGDENDDVRQIEVVKKQLGEPDESGRRRPIPIENSEFKIETDTVILAIGTFANPVLINSLPELKIDKWDYIEIDENSRTNLEGIYAGGDIVSGSATVISAMGAGKKDAGAIDEYLRHKFVLDEKGLSNLVTEFKNQFGWNYIPVQVIQEYLSCCTTEVQEKVRNKLVHIDFCNMSVSHFLEYIAKGIANSI